MQKGESFTGKLSEISDSSSDKKKKQKEKKGGKSLPGKPSSPKRGVESYLAFGEYTVSEFPKTKHRKMDKGGTASHSRDVGMEEESSSPDETFQDLGSEDVEKVRAMVGTPSEGVRSRAMKLSLEVDSLYISVFTAILEDIFYPCASSTLDKMCHEYRFQGYNGILVLFKLFTIKLKRITETLRWTYTEYVCLSLFGEQFITRLRKILTHPP